MLPNKTIILLLSLGLAMLSCINSSTKALENVNESKVLLHYFNLKTSNNFYINIPETEAISEISEIICFDSIYYLRGSYIIGDEKGEVIVDNNKIIALNQSIDNKEYFVIPFLVSNQGSGIFKYIGLFVVDYNAKTISQIDTYLLGDRIILNTIDYDANSVLEIELNAHSQDQGMNEVPNKIKHFELKVDKEGIGPVIF